MPTKKTATKNAVKAAPKAAAKKAAPRKTAKQVADAKVKKAVPALKPAVNQSKPKKGIPPPVQKHRADGVKPVEKKGVAKPAVAEVVAAVSIQNPVAAEAKAAGKKVEHVKETKTPNTIVKASVSIMPENKPSEQKQNPSKSNEALVRYSDADLSDFRDLINRKMDAAKKELNYLQGLITRKDDMGGDESESRYMTMEDGSMSMEREQLSQMASRQITYIDHLEKALIRIENKTYGICRVTGKLIDKARLRAVPHATLSLEAKLGLVKPSGE
jgi:RNA polymerase-binding transcription factor DksA